MPCEYAGTPRRLWGAAWHLREGHAYWAGAHLDRGELGISRDDDGGHPVRPSRDVEGLSVRSEDGRNPAGTKFDRLELRAGGSVNRYEIVVVRERDDVEPAAVRAEDEPR